MQARHDIGGAGGGGGHVVIAGGAGGVGRRLVLGVLQIKTTMFNQWQRFTAK